MNWLISSHLERADTCNRDGCYVATTAITYALLSRRRRSAEEYVSEDWTAVAEAISHRMTELGISQRKLVDRSNLSKAIVREIQHNVVQRRRSARTLEALSIALDWHPDHLTAILTERRPPQLGEPPLQADDDVAGRLAVIEHYLRELIDKVGGIADMSRQLDQINATVEEVLDRVSEAPAERDG